jgi:hypothetical protein
MLLLSLHVAVQADLVAVCQPKCAGSAVSRSIMFPYPEACVCVCVCVVVAPLLSCLLPCCCLQFITSLEQELTHLQADAEVGY